MANPKVSFAQENFAAITPSLSDCNTKQEVAAYWFAQSMRSALIGASYKQALQFAVEALPEGGK